MATLGTPSRGQRPMLLTLIPNGSSELVFAADVTTIEEHRKNAEVTTYPVESGSNISDHRRQGLQIVRLAGLILEWSPSGAVDARGFQSGFAAGLRNEGSSADFRNNFQKLRAAEARHKPQDVLEKLIAINASNEPFALHVALKQYPTMVLTDFGWSRDVDIGNAIRFELTAQEIIFVDLQSTVLAEPAVKVDSAKKAVNNGNKAAPEATPKLKSLLTKGVDAVFE